MVVGLPRISWWRTAIGSEEVDRLLLSIEHEHISQGPVTEEFEARIADALDVPYAVATVNGSVALLLAMMALGIARGDEVIVPNRTFVATAHAALMLGATVVLVDCRPDLPTMDVSQLESKITARTKAVVAVHLNGRAVDMTALSRVAERYGIRVIEDAAQAMFSRSKLGYLGAQSDAGCFSLGMTKLISTGQGGVVVTRDRATYERLKLLRNHGVIDTLNDEYAMLGFNFKFTDLAASIGIAQLGRARERVEQVTSIYRRYEAVLRDLPFLRTIPVDLDTGEIPLWLEVLCPERDELMNYLAAHGIQTRRFLPSLNASPHLQSRGEFPNSRIYATDGLFLPSGPEQPADSIDRVLETLRAYARHS